MSRAVKIILALSLIVNVALMGMAGSFVYKKKQHQNYMKSVHDGAKKHKSEIQSKMREKLKASRGEFKTVFKGARKSHKALLEVLSAEEFDQAAFDKAAAMLLENQTDMTRIKMNVMGQVASELSADERKAMAHHLMGSVLKGNRMKGSQSSQDMQKRRQEFMRKRMEQGGMQRRDQRERPNLRLRPQPNENIEHIPVPGSLPETSEE